MDAKWIFCFPYNLTFVFCSCSVFSSSDDELDSGAIYYECDGQICQLSSDTINPDTSKRFVGSCPPCVRPHSSPPISRQPLEQLWVQHSTRSVRRQRAFSRLPPKATIPSISEISAGSSRCKIEAWWHFDFLLRPKFPAPEVRCANAAFVTASCA